jgi:hypothetical protein
MAWRNAYLVLWSVIEVIKENATQASSLVAVLAQEVVVRPLLELWVVCRVVIVTHALHTTLGNVSSSRGASAVRMHAPALSAEKRSRSNYRSKSALSNSAVLYLVDAVKVPHVLLIDIGWCDVSATTKPPLPRDSIPFLDMQQGAPVMLVWQHQIHAATRVCLNLHALTPTHLCLKVAVVEVHCRCKGVARVHDRADACCKEGYTAAGLPSHFDFQSEQTYSSISMARFPVFYVFSTSSGIPHLMLHSHCYSPLQPCKPLGAWSHRLQTPPLLPFPTPSLPVNEQQN